MHLFMTIVSFEKQSVLQNCLFYHSHHPRDPSLRDRLYKTSSKRIIIAALFTAPHYLQFIYHQLSTMMMMLMLMIDNADDHNDDVEHFSVQHYFNSFITFTTIVTFIVFICRNLPIFNCVSQESLETLVNVQKLTPAS